MQLTPVMRKYILHWGEMGSRWGVNRTVAQIHALLYLVNKPLSADEIVETLSVARSNVSNSLRELQNWGLVDVTHELGDRRDYFTAVNDTWDMLMLILEERMRREVNPILKVLRECAQDAQEDQSTDADTIGRIKDMQVFVETIAEWYEEMKGLSRPTLLALLKMGAGVAKFAGKRA